MSIPDLAVTRTCYNGSCHCGHVKYMMRVTLPADHSVTGEQILGPLPFMAESPINRIYKCNCSTCHKLNFLHCRPVSLSEDFILLSPLPSSEGTEGAGGGKQDMFKDTGMGEYRCFEKYAAWYFCEKCAAMCFVHMGSAEVVDLDVGEWKGGEKDGETRKVFRAEKGSLYLSVNAVTLDQGQEGCDLRAWADRGLVGYLDNRHRLDGNMPELSFKGPFPEGSY